MPAHRPRILRQDAQYPRKRGELREYLIAQLTNVPHFGTPIVVSLQKL